MIQLRRTLTGKFVLLLVGFLTLQGAQLGIGVLGVLRLGYDSSLVSDAAMQRLRTLLLSDLTRSMLVDRVIDKPERARLDASIAEYDAYFARLETLMLQSRRYLPLAEALSEAQSHWRSQLKPHLLAGLEAKSYASAYKALIHYQTLAPKQVLRMDKIVASLQRNIQQDSRRLAIFQSVILALSLLLGILGLIMARRIVTLPMRKLITAARAIAQGAYNQRVAIQSEDEIGELGETFNQMAVAVGEKAERIAALNQAAVHITSIHGMPELLDQIMLRGIALTAAEAACIALYDEDNKRFHHWVTQGLSKNFTENMTFFPGSLPEKSLLSSHYILSNDRPTSRYKLSKLAHDEGILAFICLPLISHARLVGVLYLYRKDRDTFLPHEVELLTTFARLATGVIENARMSARALNLAVTDELTGLRNRRLLDERLLEEVNRAKRYTKPLSLLMLDIDHFKKVNDNYGHPAGDAVLKTLGSLLARQMRDVDLAARYGGEEFAIILPETDSEGALPIAERIRRAVENLPFLLPDGREIALTVSIGVACFPQHADEDSGLVEYADRALYQAKQSGRNQVCLYAADA